MRRTEQVCSGKSVESYFKSLLPESPRGVSSPTGRVLAHALMKPGFIFTNRDNMVVT